MFSKLKRLNLKISDIARSKTIEPTIEVNKLTTVFLPLYKRIASKTAKINWIGKTSLKLKAKAKSLPRLKPIMAPAIIKL